MCGVHVLPHCDWNFNRHRYDRSSLLVVACLTAIVSCSRRQQRGNAALDLVAEDTPKLGCVWDGTGCAEGCDAEAMEARCQRLSHDQEECETGAGQTERYCISISISISICILTEY